MNAIDRPALRFAADARHALLASDEARLRRRRVRLFEMLIASGLPSHCLRVSSRYREDGGESTDAFLMVDAALSGRLGPVPSECRPAASLTDLLWAALESASASELETIESSLAGQ